MMMLSGPTNCQLQVTGGQAQAYGMTIEATRVLEWSKNVRDDVD